MSYNKEKMLERLERSLQRYRVNENDPVAPGSFRAIDEFYRRQPGYEQRAYHNYHHVISVTALFDLLAKIDDASQSQISEVFIARKAILLHDVGHSGWPDSYVSPEDGLDNIERAIKLTREFLTQEQMSEDYQQQVCEYVALTRYPIDPAAPTGQTSEQVVALMRDADILWGLMPENAEQSMLGLWLEQVASGAAPDAPCDIEALLMRQIHFIRDYKPLSPAGQHFKAAFYIQGTEAWAHVALEFMRQVEAAKAVEELSDHDLLRLSSAIKNGLRDPQ